MITTLDNMARKYVAARNGRPFQTPLRIKIGKVLMIYAALPLLSAWAFIPGYLMALPMSPTLWARDKIRYFRESRTLR